MERRVKYKMKVGLKIVGAFLFVGLLASCSSYKVLNIDVLHPGELKFCLSTGNWCMSRILSLRTSCLLVCGYGGTRLSIISIMGCVMGYVTGYNLSYWLKGWD